jgi:excinuclease ABC subunit C
METPFHERLTHLPAKPGVYIMKNRDGEIIYIGKAKVLRNRVRSYFQGGADDGRWQFKALVANVADIEYIVTDTEVEALILEANLIKEHKPRYNINLKDDKKYPFIKITHELYPQVLIVRDVKKDGARYFGPYTDVRAVRNTVEMLHRLFPIRTCQGILPSKRIDRVCVEYHIKRCQGPCEGLVSVEDYNRMIDACAFFLAGKSREVIDMLKGRMEAAARELRFEEAAMYRDRLADLQGVRDRQKVVTPDGGDWDIIAVAREDDEACGLVMEVRQGRLLGRKHYFLGGVASASDAEVVEAFVRQFYLTAMVVPPEVHLPCEIGEEERATIGEWLSERAGGTVTLKVPQRGGKAGLLKMAEGNARLLLTERRLKREKLRDRLPHSVEALQRDLRLPKPPRRIEAFDISNIQGADAVASLVVFWDGKPRKDEYRKFKIQTVEGPNDFASMREVVRRRFRRLIEEGREKPDLVLIDGGAGQLASALAALYELKVMDQPIVGLAKRLEEIYLPGVPDPQTLPRTSSSLKLLQAIRDEAHRFAVTFHRTLRGKRLSASLLDEIPGVGEMRKTALLKRFGSVRKVAEAEVGEVAAVEGIREKLAEVIKGYLEVYHL